MKAITTYKYYDEKGRRLAIRARKIGAFQLDILVLTCSKKDVFKKSFARQALDQLEEHDTVRLFGELLHPQKFTLTNNGHFSKSFFDWANGKFFRKKFGYKTYETEELRRGNEYFILKENRQHNKLSKRYGQG